MPEIIYIYKLNYFSSGSTRKYEPEIVIQSIANNGKIIDVGILEVVHELTDDVGRDLLNRPLQRMTLAEGKTRRQMSLFFVAPAAALRG